jgi:hypothetical protein
MVEIISPSVRHLVSTHSVPCCQADAASKSVVPGSQRFLPFNQAAASEDAACPLISSFCAVTRHGPATAIGPASIFFARISTEKLSKIGTYSSRSPQIRPTTIRSSEARRIDSIDGSADIRPKTDSAARSICYATRSDSTKGATLPWSTCATCCCLFCPTRSAFGQPTASRPLWRRRQDSSCFTAYPQPWADIPPAAFLCPHKAVGVNRMTRSYRYRSASPRLHDRRLVPRRIV